MQTNIPLTKQSLKTRGIQCNTDVWLKQLSQRDTEYWGLKDPMWIIDNKIYDLTQFAFKHPGGSSWINLTKGQDITTLFRTHHLQYQKVLQMLPKYYKGQCPIKNQNRFDFDSTGHYDAIRKLILNKWDMKQLQDTSITKFRCTIILAIWCILFILTGYFQSYILAFITGYWTMTCWAAGHLFVHKKDNNWLRHAFLLNGFSAREQQIMHSISHHPYTNTMLDYEYAAVQPFIYFARTLPQGKWYKPIVFQIIMATSAMMNVLTKLIVLPITNKSMPSFQHATLFTLIIFLYFLCWNWGTAFKLFLTITLTNGFFVGKMLLCPHRQAQLWSQGAPEIRDYVLHQIASATDFNPQSSSYESLIIYSGFNVHILHHLFPTIDHHILPECNKIFMDYCKSKGLKILHHTYYECNKSLFKILIQKIPFQIKLFLSQ